MQELRNMTIEELRQLAKNIKIELDNRIEEIKEVKKEVETLCLEEYEFYFKTECTYTYKGYVAKCYYEKGLQRKFYNIEETKNNRDIVIEGNFKAKELDILDIRHRNINYGDDGYYIILDGKLTQICDKNDIHEISAIKRYLKGEIIFDNFLEIVGLKEIKVGVIDELLED